MSSSDEGVGSSPSGTPKRPNRFSAAQAFDGDLLENMDPSSLFDEIQGSMALPTTIAECHAMIKRLEAELATEKQVGIEREKAAIASAAALHSSVLKGAAAVTSKHEGCLIAVYDLLRTIDAPAGAEMMPVHCHAELGDADAIWRKAHSTLMSTVASINDILRYNASVGIKNAIEACKTPEAILSVITEMCRCFCTIAESMERVETAASIMAGTDRPQQYVQAVMKTVAKYINAGVNSISHRSAKRRKVAEDK